MARPREFDHDIVSDKIMKLFWKNGFEGTSMKALVSATGLKKGSLYSCFGNKSQLFELALDRYCRPKLRASEHSALENLLRFYSGIINESKLPAAKRLGCLLMNSGLEFGNKHHHLTPKVIGLLHKREQYFYDLIKEAKKNGEISKNIDLKKAAERALATAFTIREMCKFKPEREFLTDLANSFFESLGTNKRINF